jgi:hypothetical protein
MVTWINWQEMWREWVKDKLSRNDTKGWWSNKHILREWHCHIDKTMREKGYLVVQDEKPEKFS